MNDAPAPEELPANLRLLRVLVTVLLVVMILGFVVIVALFVIRFKADPMPLPAEIALPAGETARAVTYGNDWYGVVTESDQFLIFDSKTGALRQQINIEERE